MKNLVDEIIDGNMISDDERYVEENGEFEEEKSSNEEGEEKSSNEEKNIVLEEGVENIVLEEEVIGKNNNV